MGEARKRSKVMRVPRQWGGRPLLDFIAAELAVSRRRAKAFLDRRDVFVDNRRVWMARHTLETGSVVEVVLDGLVSGGESRIAILARNANYLVVHKPPGTMTCGEAGSLEARLRAELGLPEAAAVHRLDRETSGCVIFAVNSSAYERIVPLFRDKKVLKHYHAIVERRMKELSKTIRARIDGMESVTRVRLLDACGLASHLEVRIDTGRTHQIRRHLARVGHPVLGDRRYGSPEQDRAEYRRVVRQMLHAERVKFEDPFDGSVVDAADPLPGDFRACLKRFGLT